MKNNKSIISTLLMLFIIFSAIGLAFAAGGTGSGGGGGTGNGTGNGTTNGTTNGTNTTNGTAIAKISVAFDKSTAKVGDNVTMIVTITNAGTINFINIIVSAPLPEGLKYSLHVTGLDKANYTSSDGTWDVGNLKTTSKLAGVKMLNVTAEVLPSAAGKNLTTTARYVTISQNATTPDSSFKKPGAATSNVLTIENVNTGTGNGTGTGSGTGSGNSNTGTTDKKNAIKDAIKNATSSSGFDALQNLNQPAQGSAYEVTNATAPVSSDNSKTAYAVLGGLIIATIVGIGYFKGIRG